MPDIATTLREAITASGKSQRELAAIAEIPQPLISKLVSGLELRTDTASKLAAALGLELREKRRKK